MLGAGYWDKQLVALQRKTWCDKKRKYDGDVTQVFHVLFMQRLHHFPQIWCFHFKMFWVFVTFKTHVLCAPWLIYLFLNQFSVAVAAVGH